MNEILEKIPFIYIFILIVLPITLFIGITIICYRIKRIDEIMDDIIQNQTKQNELLENLIILEKK